MDIHTIRMELRTKSIYDLPLRVTYYARVSSESDEQLNSLGNQVSYYEDLIRRNLPWTFVPGQYWTPAETMGKELVQGDVTEANAEAKTKAMVKGILKK